MNRYDGETLQDRLAREFVLGSLRGAARRRLVALMRERPELRHKVHAWEERLFPLMLRAPRVRAPARVWRKVHARISPRGLAATEGRSRWRNALAGVVLAALALIGVGVALLRDPPFTMVAVLNDQRAQPAIVVSWSAAQAARGRLALRVLAHPDMPPGTSWEAWLLRASGAAPVSMGLVGIEADQVLELPGPAASMLASAEAIGISVERKGGSPSAMPSGPFLFQGAVLRLDR